MQRWYSRLAGYHRLACLGGKSHVITPSHASRLFSSSSNFAAYKQQQSSKRPPKKSKKRPGSIKAEEHASHPAYLPSSKLPSLKEQHKPDAWLSLLNTVLPEHLRADVPGGLHHSASASLTPRDVALILRRAQRAYGFDLLTYLGVDKGQWKAVTWIVTRIVDKIWDGHSDVAKTSLQAKLPGPWKSRASLKEMTEAEHGIQLEPPTGLAPQSLRTLDEMTIEDSPLHEPLQAAFNHEILGVVWRSLGNMIIADAGRTDKVDPAITPEILEVIAALHHNGMMPSSIYSYQPSDNYNALRQPPTLHLLSSHILTSLSDAAWRAHESLVVQEAKAKGGEYLSMRPEIPGSMYKVHVAGLGHEVWLELVLWSCLHGKWIEDGAAILRNAVEKPSWSALSWRELALPLIKPGQEKSINWDDLRYRLNAGHAYGDPNLTKATKARVKRTISTEVVAAYVEALLNVIRTSVGIRGTPAFRVLNFILPLKSFLDRNNLSLGFTSWDAIVYRFFDSQGLVINGDPKLAERIVRHLSSEFGEGLAANSPARNAEWQPLPDYVLDGTAIGMGLMHRVLRAYIESGNLGGALRTFEELQHMTDRNKEKSIKNFFAKQAMEAVQPTNDHTSSHGAGDDNQFNFQSHLAGIEYPAFYPQLPSTLLAAFLDLVTETRSFEFGSWLLHSTDIDGPVIPSSLYVDPIVGPALIRFASAKSDIELLVSLLEAQGEGKSGTDTPSNLPRYSLMALLQGQLKLRKWDTVDDILDNIRDSPSYPLAEEAIGLLTAAVVRDVDPHKGPSWHSASPRDLDRAMYALLRVHSDASGTNPEIFFRVRTALMVLGSINPKWESFIWSLQEYATGGQRYTMTPRSFNPIIEAVLDAYGTEQGKRFLGRFWKASTDQQIVGETSRQQLGFAGVVRMPAMRPGAVYKPSSSEVHITIGRQEKGRRAGRLHGRFTPNTITVTTVLRRALRDCQGSKAKMATEVEWATQMLRHLGLPQDDVTAEVDRVVKQVGQEREI